MRFLCEQGHTYIQNENTAQSKHYISSSTDYTIIFVAFNIVKLTGTLILTTQDDSFDTSSQPAIDIKITYENSLDDYTFVLGPLETISILAADIHEVYCKCADNTSGGAHVTMKYLYDYFIDCDIICD